MIVHRKGSVSSSLQPSSWVLDRNVKPGNTISSRMALLHLLFRIAPYFSKILLYCICSRCPEIRFLQYLVFLPVLIRKILLGIEPQVSCFLQQFLCICIHWFCLPDIVECHVHVVHCVWTTITILSRILEKHYLKPIQNCFLYHAERQEKKTNSGSSGEDDGSEQWFASKKLEEWDQSVKI